MQRRLQEQTGSNAECLLAASAHVALSYEMLDRVRACLRRLTLRCCADPPRTKSQHRSVPARMKDDEVEQSSKQRAQPSTACSSWHTAQLRAVHTQSAINRVIPLEAEHLGDRDCAIAAGLTVLESVCASSRRNAHRPGAILCGRIHFQTRPRIASKRITAAPGDRPPGSIASRWRLDRPLPCPGSEQCSAAEGGFDVLISSTVA